MSQSERLYWIDSEIHAGRYPNADIVAERFEISRRAAYNDRDILVQRLGAPLIYSRPNGGWTYSNPTFCLPFLALSEKEAHALARTFLAAKEYLGESDAALVDTLARKLSQFAPPARPGTSASVGGSLHASTDVSVSVELLSDCESAIRNRQRLEIVYYSAHRDQTSERIVQPYHLHNWQGEWHLIAWCEHRQAIRQFYLGRIRHCRVIPPEGSYAIDPTFDSEQYLSHGFGLLHGDDLITVKLRFSAWQSRWIKERIYHPSQITESLDNGQTLVTLQVSGLSEIKRWIQSYGAEVEVLEPEQLREQIINNSKMILEKYEE